MGCDVPKDEVEKIVCDVQQREGSSDIFQTTRENLDVQKKAQEKIKESIGYIGSTEYNYILEYFDISGASSEIVEQITSLQKNVLHVSVDGIIGPATLKQIYIQKYSQDPVNLPKFQQWRNYAYETVGKNYPDWKRYVSEKDSVVTLRTSPPNVFNKNYYIGNTQGEPVPGTFINNSLISIIPESKETKGVQGFVRKIDGKFVLYIYVDGVLELASYTSPGNVEKYGEDAESTQGTWSRKYLANDNVDTLTAKIYYISGGEDSVVNSQNSDGSFNSDPMAFAVRVVGGVFTHAGYTTGTPESHGCFRLPLHYAIGVHDIFRRIRTIHWDTNWS